MKMVRKSIAIAASAGILALGGQQALADKGDLSVSLKYSKPRPDTIGVDGVDVDAKGDQGFGIALGYEYNTNWTIEFEYLTSESTDNDFVGNVTLKTTGFGLYGVYRTQRSISDPYLFGRVGVGQTEFKFTQPGFTGASADDTGLAFGAGVGYQYSDRLSVEAEYFIEDADYAHILLSVRYALNASI